MVAPSFHIRGKSPQSRSRESPAVAGGIRATRFRVDSDEFVVFTEPTMRSFDFLGLSEAERKVAFLVACGCSNKAIAARRRVSPQTVANQLAAIYRKLGVTSRSEMIARFLDLPAERRRRQGGA
jgi:DNA-binding NarL/FixJ family response regulator